MISRAAPVSENARGTVAVNGRLQEHEEREITEINCVSKQY